MTRLVYLSYPIDSVEPQHASRLQSEVSDVRNALARISDVVVFDPGRAWLLGDETPEPDSRLYVVDELVVARADAIVAVLPPGSESIGVPMEIRVASQMGIPSLVIRNKPSWALHGLPHVHLFPSVEDAMDLFHLVDKRIPPSPRVAKFVVDDDTYGVDVTPTRAHDDDAGFDLRYSGEVELVINPKNSIDVPAGLRLEWPPNTWGLLVGRSSSFHKRGMLVNTAIIDPGYRGPMFAAVRNISRLPIHIQPGERIAQIVPLPALASRIEMQQADSLSGTTRGENGFGSSGL